MAQTGTIRVAAAQLSPDLDTPANTVTRVLGAIAEAAGKGARLIVFPETFVPCTTRTSPSSIRRS